MTIVAENAEPANSEISPPPSPWPVIGSIFLVSLLILLALYWQTVASIVTLWFKSDTYAHGMLIAPITVFMIWTRRAELARLTPRPSFFGLLALALVCLVWLVAHTADVLVVQQLALVSMIVTLIYATLGRAVFQVLLFPLAYLYFVVPFGDDLIPILQDFTARFSVKLLQLSNVPVLIEAFYITLPSKINPLAMDRFLVAEACSGSRYLMASLALGCIYAYFSYQSFTRRAAFVALAIVFPIIANGLRAYGIIMIAHHSGMEYAVGVDHLIYGWLFFGLLIVVMFWIGSFWREPVVEIVLEPLNAPGDYRISPWIGATAGVALLIGGAVQAAAVQFHNGDRHDSVNLVAPVAPMPWREVRGATPVLPPALGATQPRNAPHYIGAGATIDQIYELDGQLVRLYVAFYPQERQGAELINVVNVLYDTDYWRKIDSKLLPENRRQLELDRGSRSRLLWYWYRVGGYDIQSAFKAKILRAWDQISGTRKGSAVIAITTDYTEVDPSRAEALLLKFTTAVWPALHEELEKAAGR